MKTSSYFPNNLAPNSNITSIAIGGFDGFHLAHYELFHRLKSNGAIVVIESGYSNITPKDYRANFTDLPIYYYELSSIKHLCAEEFLNILIKQFPNLNHIVVGYDFAFGANRTHKADDLKELFMSLHSGNTAIIDEFLIDNISVHSKAIREYITSSKIELANRLIGRDYQISGQAISGQGLGKSDFVPTINLEVHEFILPSDGIYTTYTIVENIRYKSVSFLGHRATTDNNYAIETHILDNDINIKDNQEIKIEFLKKQRDNKKFNTFEELKAQIEIDIKEAY